MRDNFCFNANLEAAAEFAAKHDATGVHVEVVAHFPLYFVTVPSLPDSEIGPTVITMVGGGLTCAFLWFTAIELVRQALSARSH